jgi:hypothetical protein
LREELLLGFACHALGVDDRLQQLPPRLRFYLRAGLADQERHNEPHLAATVRLAQQFAATSQTLVFFKGAVLAHRFYGHLHARPYRDADVLVAVDDLEAVHHRLHQDGWRGEAAPFTSHEIKYLKPDPIDGAQNSLRVDVHHTIRLDDHYRPDLAGLLSRRTPTELQGQPLWVLSDEDHLAALLTLLFFDLLSGKASLRQVLDVYHALRHLDGRLDWPSFMAARQAEGLGTIVPTMLHMVLTLLDAFELLPHTAAHVEPPESDNDYLELLEGSRAGGRWGRVKHRAQVYSWAAGLYEPREHPGLYLVKRAVSHAHWRWSVRHMDPTTL